MSLLDNTQLLLESAMSGSMYRQTLLTNDLANADTPGFQPQDVNFQQQLASAVAGGQSPTSVQFTPSTNNAVLSSDGNGVDTNVVNAEIAENGLLYQTLTQVAASSDQTLQDAINTTT
ncbi:MAG: flagellar basal body rod protein FlgB [Solirubrobacteraceae bacterium]